MPAILGFIGWHNSGKTTIIRKVAALLQVHGYKLAVIKASSDLSLSLDKAGSDTALYWQDGIAELALLSPDQFLFRSRAKPLGIQALVARFFSEADLVLVEGCKHAEIAKIEVRRHKQDPPLWQKVSGVIAVVSEYAVAEGLRRFDPQQHEELASFIEGHFWTHSAK